MVASVSTEPITLGEVVAWEADEGAHAFCRETYDVLAGSGATRTLTVGMVVGVVTATGQVAQVDDTAVDGTAVAAGVCLTDSITAPDGTDQPGAVVLVRGPAILKTSGLVFLGTMDAAAQATAIGELAALGIVIR